VFVQLYLKLDGKEPLDLTEEVYTAGEGRGMKEGGGGGGGREGGGEGREEGGKEKQGGGEGREGEGERGRGRERGREGGRWHTMQYATSQTHSLSTCHEYSGTPVYMLHVAIQ